MEVLYDSYWVSGESRSVKQIKFGTFQNLNLQI